MDKVLVLLGAIIGVGLIVWWFFGKRKVVIVAAELRDGKQVVRIVVDGGYTPSVVQLQKDIPAELVFVRKDPSACFEEVVLPDFGTSTHLPVNKPYTISVNPDTPGEYKYSCGMHMFFGKVIVK